MAAARDLALVLLLVALTLPARAAELLVEWAPLAVRVESYQVERRVDEPQAAFAPIARVGSDAVRFTDRSVVVGVRYCYRVRGTRGGRMSPPSPELCSVATERAAAAPIATAPQPEPEPVRAALPASADRDVKALRRPPPVYPREAVAAGISGWVKLQFTVAADGTTRDIRVIAAEPPGVFDEAALEAATRFVYSPRIERGVAVDRPEVETEITFTWIDRGGELVTGRRAPGPR
jgi:TonB family protein